MTTVGVEYDDGGVLGSISYRHPRAKQSADPRIQKKVISSSLWSRWILGSEAENDDGEVGNEGGGVLGFL